MKSIKAILIGVSLLWWATSGVFAEVSQKQALLKARAFLDSIGVTANVPPQFVEQEITGWNHPVWQFAWDYHRLIVRVSAYSGDVLEFDNAQLQGDSRRRCRSGEVPAMMAEEEALRLAQEFALRVGLPVRETKAEARFEPYRFSATEVSAIGEWYISFRRFYNGYRTPDYFSSTIEPYDRQIIRLKVDWGTPMCETVVNLTEEEATRLALEGFAAMGVAAIRDEKHLPVAKLMIVRPNFDWTDYMIPEDAVPFTRLAWLISAAQDDGSPIGIVSIDAATGEWLGGRRAGGSRVKIKSVPPQANGKAFLISRFTRSKEICLEGFGPNRSIVLKPGDRARWSALGSLLATLRPQKQATPGPGEEYITFTGKERTYHLKRAGNALRLEGPDVPGSALGFQEGKDFQARLAALKAMP